MLAIILGTRPEIIKLCSVIRAAEATGTPYYILHTNQHYSPQMDQVFFEELELPEPRYNLGIGSGSHGAQTGAMLAAIEPILADTRPDVVLVQGDTNTVLAGALAASKLGLKVGHVEAGLRSYDRSMPEEINRIVTDHISDYLFTPTAGASAILRREGIEERLIHKVGNTVVDAVLQNRALAERKSQILGRLDLKEDSYLLVTLHRPANVDDKPTLKGIIAGLAQVAAQAERPIIFPAHPRTKKQLDSFGIDLPSAIRLIEPVGYLDFLELEQKAWLILTDSGGIQEEACILGVPCVTIRDNTERPETVEVGANLLAGTTARGIATAAQKMLEKKPDWTNPFGDGTTGHQIIEITAAGRRLNGVIP